MLTQATSLSLTARRPAVPVRSRAPRLAVHANTLWSLTPACANKQLGTVELTGTIGVKKLCSVGSADYMKGANEAVDLCILDHGGIHVIFDSVGEANPLDSPSVLFITDIDSACDVKVDGVKMEKGVRTRVKPGAVIDMGEDCKFQVQRNVFAHA